MGRRPRSIGKLKWARGKKTVKDAAAKSHEMAMEDADCDQRILELCERAVKERADERSAYEAVLSKLHGEACEGADCWSDEEWVCVDCDHAEVFCSCPRYDDHDKGRQFTEVRFESPAF